jgi:transcriptional regulator with XRE-family HTH domain
MLTTKDVPRLRFELMAREHVQRIGARIRRRREELGLSQAAVAEEMPSPIDGNYISRWERGQHKPSDESLDRLAEILQTDRAYFLTDSIKAGTPDFLGGGREPAPTRWPLSE